MQLLQAPTGRETNHFNIIYIMTRDSLVSLPDPAPHQLLTNPLQSFEQLTAPSPTAVITAGILILLLWNTSIMSPAMKETSSGMWRMENSTYHQKCYQYAITQSSQLTVIETQEAGCDPQSTEGSRTSFSVHLCSPGTIWRLDINMHLPRTESHQQAWRSFYFTAQSMYWRFTHRLCSIIPNTQILG